MRAWHFNFLIGLFLLGPTSMAFQNLERDLSVSKAYDSRSLFTNPAGLGFQTELNGPELLTHFSYATQENLPSEFQYSLAYGVLGLGVERLSPSEGKLTRYDLGLGRALTPFLFSGIRYSFTSSDTAGISGVHALDLGLQVRPSQYFSAGALLKQINRPEIFSVRAPMEWQIGASLRPVAPVELNLDVLFNTREFAERTAYFGNLRLEPWNGIFILGGFHSEYQWKVGFQINIGPTSLHASARPATGNQQFLVGMSAAPIPSRSILNPKTALHIRVNDQWNETPRSGGLLGKDRPAFLDLLQVLGQAAEDDSTKRIAIQLDEFPLGLASAQEFHEAILRTRQKGKPVDVFMNNAGIKEYLIAAAADRIFMEPSAELRFLGLKSERYFLKNTLDKLGIEGQFLAKGDYKSAPETFTQAQSSPHAKQQTLHQLQLAESVLISLLEKTRKINKTKWALLTQRALWSAQEAKQEGLIDEIGFQHDETAKWGLIKRESAHFRSDLLALKPKIAVVIAQGDLLQKKVPLLNWISHPQITPSKMESDLKAAKEDPRTQAIVVRVNSPGGEIVASDQIASQMLQTKKSKPVFVSMGDVAASGGYMISAPATAIFAKPLTLTGSIGVFLGKFNLGNLYRKLELHKEILSHSPYAGLLSEDHPWTAEEKTILTKRLNQYYSGFVNYVAEARKLSALEAENLAQGKVWLGKEAKERKLVDENGGYYEAIQAAAKTAGLLPGEFDVMIVQPPKNWWGLIGDDDLLLPNASLAALELFPGGFIEDLPWLLRQKDSPFLYLSEVKSFR